jgi:hypothetical protein
MLAKARSLLERRLSRAPDDEAAAAALAEVLTDADGSSGWSILKPDIMTSARGATLTRLPDGSVLAGGLNPAVDTFTIEAISGLSGITGLRLEAIPHPSLPHQGPGRIRMATSTWTQSACTPSPSGRPRSRSACRGPAPIIRNRCTAPWV